MRLTCPHFKVPYSPGGCPFHKPNLVDGERRTILECKMFDKHFNCPWKGKIKWNKERYRHDYIMQKQKLSF